MTEISENDNSMESEIEAKAEAVARAQVEYVNHSMALENQALPQSKLEEFIKPLKQKLIKGSHGQQKKGDCRGVTQIFGLFY